jgi:hypothetical protein
MSKISKREELSLKQSKQDELKDDLIYQELMKLEKTDKESQQTRHDIDFPLSSSSVSLFFRIAQLVQYCLEKGWNNITNYEIRKKFEESLAYGDTSLLLDSRTFTRQTYLRAHIFRSLLNDDILDELVKKFNANVPVARESSVGRPKKPFTKHEVLMFIVILLFARISGYSAIEEYREGLPQRTLTSKRFRKMYAAFTIDLESLTEKINSLLKKAFNPGGNASWDETMWAWEGDHWALVFIERKPTPFGFKILTICFVSKVTGRPYLWHFVPSITRESVPIVTVLQEFKEAMQAAPNVPVCADRWFGQLSFLCANAAFPITLALKRDQDTDLLTAMAYNLKPYQYRIFSNGKTFITVYADGDKLVINGSNYFEQTGAPPQPLPVEDYHFFKNRALLTLEETIEIRDKLSMSAKQKLCTALGYSSRTSDFFPSFSLLQTAPAKT